MNKRRSFDTDIVTDARMLLISGLVFILIGCLGCTRTIYVPAERKATDTLINVKIHSDTIVTRDSIYLEKQGDISIKEVYRWRDRIRLRVDTVYKTRIDSVAVIIPACDQRKNATKPGFTARIKEGATSLCKYIAFATMCMILLWIARRRFV